ncbi:UDP-N-acetylglucosamine 2-epimerase [Lysinibacillus fusiformis]|uniref:UDP-N-acetylglucosamine 2-epimerase n=1 Tax=Lysinibacillus fusiformis TaxID=28031 RepID=UPI00187FFD10|nr:UDP-N-acetylglucosamine 2-epimerase [Lysinibacillus fusiformis]MBD8519604.1 UDP-N-acetylglucosamine 2-epimerase (hydrolyzing) [Lysinibacillus fusiformis]MCR8851186.1 UDP-N-acetylglucosamine 2-epimerase [Lysinibacillus fusiformis]WKT77716.1 UDP-N-acetylglucosamine 2-epimerase [Lysinibacillus fusiformis]
MKRKICVVTGTRAEYGLLANLMHAIKQSADFELQLVVTGMHLSSEFGLTYKQIEEDGFVIDAKVEMLLSSDTATGVAKSIGLATIGFSDAFEKVKPDLLLILGDRFEMLAAAQTALVMQIPIAHIHGGECTFGAYDDAIRHSITKMASWHFTSTDTHRNRVIQLGEEPSSVWNVGAIGIENILKLPLLKKEKLYTDLQLNIDQPMFLITYHPETNLQTDGIYALLEALNNYPSVNLVFTKANADNGGREINRAIEEFVSQRQNAKVFDSLGQLRYLSTVKYADVVLGNSSSGLIEVPYLHTPTVNCGDRQAGRQKPSSVFDCTLESSTIEKAIEKALMYKGPYDQIFGDGQVSEKIMRQLQQISSFARQKEFYDL